MAQMFADVIIDVSVESLNRPFSYIVPEELSDKAVPGCRVRVPLGRGSAFGYITALKTKPGYELSKMKPILEVVAGEETADERLLSLAFWMNHTYGGPLALSLRTVLPVKKKIRGVEVRYASLTDRGKALSALASLRSSQIGRRRALTLLLKVGELSFAELRDEGVTDAVLKTLAKEGVIEIRTEDHLRRVVRETDSLREGAGLSTEQAAACEAIREEWQGSGRPVLLTGVTGSGKTMVYMEMIADTLSSGRQAIVLIPEIALTRQNVDRFVARFGNRVSFLHSRLSAGERYDQMRAARRGEVSIMVGPRSALFTPFSDLGLIVIDEEQEETYHSEQMPRYDARETALARARIEGAHVLLGSATPSLSSYARMREGEFAGVTLRGRFGPARLPECEIVDMRKELSETGRTLFSRSLVDKLSATLQKGEQAMLFLNRRGYEGFVTCRSCGYVARCPHCDVTLTRHLNGRLICHYCGYEEETPRVCPKCGSPHIGGLSVGTEQVEERVREILPGVRTLRMDLDTTRGKGGHEGILEAFREGEADILIGTQMIVKGHDFPRVTLIGVLSADLSLFASDYRSAERTYQLIAQAVGRAGRGELAGHAVIQTFEPEHYAILAGARQDYEAFFEEEYAYRRMLRYPPAGCMMAVLGSAENEDLLKTGRAYLKKYIERIDPRGTLRVIGPAPQAVGKIRDRYRMVLYLRHEKEAQLIRARELLEAYIRVNSGFEKIETEFELS